MKFSISCFFFVLLAASSCGETTRPKKVKPAQPDSCTISFKADLEKLDGFFSEVESEPIELGMLNIPQELLIYKKKAIRNSKLTALKEVTGGYLINVKLYYGYQYLLLCATLDENYCMRDYRFFPDGTSDFKYADTIAWTTFSKNNFDVELMHLNQEEVPSFEKDGIKKFHFEINDRLELIEK